MGNPLFAWKVTWNYAYSSSKTNKKKIWKYIKNTSKKKLNTKFIKNVSKIWKKNLPNPELRSCFPKISTIKAEVTEGITLENKSIQNL